MCLLSQELSLPVLANNRIPKHAKELKCQSIDNLNNTMKFYPTTFRKIAPSLPDRRHGLSSFVSSKNWFTERIEYRVLYIHRQRGRSKRFRSPDQQKNDGNIQG
jgi:hypothetical protein